MAFWEGYHSGMQLSASKKEQEDVVKVVKKIVTSPGVVHAATHLVTGDPVSLKHCAVAVASAALSAAMKAEKTNRSNNSPPPKPMFERYDSSTEGPRDRYYDMP